MSDTSATMKVYPDRPAKPACGRDPGDRHPAERAAADGALSRAARQDAGGQGAVDDAGRAARRPACEARLEQVDREGGGDGRGSATVAGFAHAAAGDEVLKNVLAAVGYKAYEIGSYKVLVTLAQAAGATEDLAIPGAVDARGAGDGRLAGRPHPRLRARVSGATVGVDRRSVTPGTSTSPSAAGMTAAEASSPTGRSSRAAFLAVALASPGGRADVAVVFGD